jgi:sucrose-6-phosphate hydrolase SacC (GH32 family)
MRKQGGRVLLYRSKDLRQWQYLHPLAGGHWTARENINPVDSGEMWECPDFFPLGLMLADAARPWWSMKVVPFGTRVWLQVNGSSIDLAMPEAGEMTFHLL